MMWDNGIDSLVHMGTSWMEKSAVGIAFTVKVFSEDLIRVQIARIWMDCIQIGILIRAEGVGIRMP